VGWQAELVGLGGGDMMAAFALAHAVLLPALTRR
jgi:hypothetical protein